MHTHAPNTTDRRRTPAVVADPICPVCGQVTVAHYDTLLRASPHTTLRAAERPCRCAGRTGARPVSAAALLAVLVKRFGTAAAAAVMLRSRARDRRTPPVARR